MAERRALFPSQISHVRSSYNGNSKKKYSNRVVQRCLLYIFFLNFRVSVINSIVSGERWMADENDTGVRFAVIQMPFFWPKQARNYSTYKFTTLCGAHDAGESDAMRIRPIFCRKQWQFVNCDNFPSLSSTSSASGEVKQGKKKEWILLNERWMREC